MAHAGINLSVLLPPPPKCWDYRYGYYAQHSNNGFRECVCIEGRMMTIGCLHTISCRKTENVLSVLLTRVLALVVTIMTSFVLCLSFILYLMSCMKCNKNGEIMLHFTIRIN
jgi:hypothetical protein